MRKKTSTDEVGAKAAASLTHSESPKFQIKTKNTTHLLSSIPFQPCMMISFELHDQYFGLGEGLQINFAGPSVGTCLSRPSRLVLRTNTGVYYY